MLPNPHKYLLNNILSASAFKDYTTLPTNNQLRDLGVPNAFSLVTHDGAVVGCNEMLEIVPTIFFFVVDACSSRRMTLGPSSP